MTGAALTEALVSFVRSGGPFPAAARQRAVDALTDAVGCCIAGSGEPLAAILLEVIAAGRPSAKRLSAPLLGTAFRASLAEAALYNGAVGHALDYDDTNHPGYAHPSAVLLPALLSLACRSPVCGVDFIEAYIVGLEVFGRLGRALNPTHYQHGWHPTASFGALAAAAAGARLDRLGEVAATRALAIAASAAGGLRCNFGSMTKPLHAGYAARNGVLAVLLAERGFTASEAPLDHRFGYLSVLGAAPQADLSCLEAWGEPLEILGEFGIALKPFPSCGATHPGIEAALRLRSRLGRPLEEVAAIRLGVPRMAFAPLIHVQPKSGLEGKFSLHYCVAAALLDGKVERASFEDGAVLRPEIARLIARTTMEEDARVREDPEFATHLEIAFADGTTDREFVPLAEGKPARWFSEDRLKHKFDDCAGGHLEPAARGALFASLRGLERTPDVARLLARCDAAQRP